MHPFVELFGIRLSSYFMLISLACVVSALWFIRRAEDRALNRVVAIDITLTVLISGFIGARLLHIFFEEPAFYRQYPMAAFEVWNGGFVFLGGVLSAWLAASLFCRWRNEPFWFWADVAALPIAMGYAIGRLACLLNGCCFGKYCTMPWAVVLHGGPRHPTQLYASAWELVVLLVLWKFEPRFKISGLLFNTWLVAHALGRMLMELYREDPRGPLLSGLSLGTWISLALAAYGLFNIITATRQKHPTA